MPTDGLLDKAAKATVVRFGEVAKIPEYELDVCLTAGTQPSLGTPGNACDRTADFVRRCVLQNLEMVRCEAWKEQSTDRDRGPRGSPLGAPPTPPGIRVRTTAVRKVEVSAQAWALPWHRRVYRAER